MGRLVRRRGVVFLIAGLLWLSAISTACSRSERSGETGPSAIPSNTEPAPAETNLERADAGRSAVSAGEVTVKALSLFKDGPTKVFRTDLASIPQAPPLPDRYTPLNAVYKLESEAVFSDAVITIAGSPGDAVDFQSVRVLRLDANDMYPDGFVWSDCTILKDRKTFPGAADSYYPDPTKRSVSCYFDRTSGTSQGLYFALVSATVPPRTTAATTIRIRLEKAELMETGDGMRYLVTVENSGPEDVAEVNVHSTFSIGVVLADARPATGRCQPARYGSSDSSVVCFLGGLKVGAKTQVEFTAKPGIEKPALDRKFNRTWVIRGFSRKGPGDEVVPSDVFKFEPLAK